METRRKLVAIVGPTASGKSAMAIALAKKYNGEIICADSRTIYKETNIGTAKPTRKEQETIMHHCLDMVMPNESYSAAQFKKAANNAIADINNRGKLAFLVGGSGLYIDSVLYDFSFTAGNTVDVSSYELRDLQNLALKMNLRPSAQTNNNPRHLASFIRRNGVSSKKTLTSGALVVGIKANKEVLDERIDRRVESMFKAGLINETRTLLKKWDKNAPGFLTPGYIPVIEYLSGNIDLNEAKRLFKRNDKQLAKRQMTWFKRNKDIHWVEDIQKAEQLIKEKIR